MSCCRTGPNGGCCGESWCVPPEPEEDEMTDLQRINNALLNVDLAKSDLGGIRYKLTEAQRLLEELGERLGGERTWGGMFLPEQEEA